MYQKLILGQFWLLGRRPDGDSVAFIADDTTLFADLYRAYKMKFNQANGSVQLRLEGIDSPETQYGPDFAQPLSLAARDALLVALGFDLAQLVRPERLPATAAG
jgi:hypothetical protein